MKFSVGQLLLIALVSNMTFASGLNGQHSKNVFEVEIEISAKKASIYAVFKQIEAKTNYRFSLNEKILEDKPRVTVQENNLGDALASISAQAKLNFRQINQVISVSEPDEKDGAVEPVEVIIYDKELKGKVIDEDTGEPLIGATIQVKGTSIGVVTDVDGAFSLAVPESAKTLVVSYVGFSSQELTIGNQTYFEVSLELIVEALSEVVVVGYGIQKKVNLTGAVASVEGDLINQRPIAQGSQMLQGLSPGLFVNTNSGEPGNDDASINIRGIGTFGDAAPLVLIDGIEAPLANINPHDIETINILKDAASAAIYGTRAANGVILITTKRGNSGEAVVTYNNSVSVTSPTVLPNLVTDTKTYLETFVRAAQYSNRNTAFNDNQALIDELASYGSTDWLDEFVGTGLVQDHDLSISGGNDRTRYRLSTRYFDQNGYLKGDWYTKRISTRLNLDTKLSEKFRAGASLAYVNTDNRQAPKNDPRTYLIDGVDGPDGSRYTGGKGNFLYTILLVSAPNAVVFDDFGRYGGTGGESSRSQRDNPQALIDNQWIDNDLNEFLGNSFLEFEPVENLTFRYTAGVNMQHRSFTETRLQYEQYDRFGNLSATRTIGSILRTREATMLNFTNWLQANYQKSFDGHQINLMAGLNQETSETRSIATVESGFGSTSLVTPGDGADVSDIGNYSEAWGLQSIFGRVSYSFEDKYLFEFNLRRDGSSRFGPNNRYATFSGLSAGYVLSNESFWSVPMIDFLKLRGSWGKIGVQPSEPFDWASRVELGEDFNGVSGASLTNFGNPDMAWEESIVTDLGMDVELLEGKFYAEFDYFIRKSEGVLTEINNSLTSGVTGSTIVNAANITNKGWELMLSSKNKFGDLGFKASVNLSHLDNEVTQINPRLTAGADQLFIGTGGDRNVWLIRGEPINAIFGHEFGGVFQTDEFNDDGSLKSGIDYSFIGTPRPGDIKYVDQNGDNRIDANDRVVIGDRNPDWIYGLNLEFTYKGFDFGTIFQGVGGVNSWVNRYTGNFGHSGLREFWLNGWTEDNPSNEIPRIFVDRDGFNGQSIEGLGGQAQSEFWVIDQSYLRLKNIVLGYTFPTSMLGNTIKNLRLYVSAQNIWTKTDLEDLDPERSQYSNHFGGTLPQAKGFTTGLNITF